ncbi:tRNA threonylcarbamoyladenosine biosynthesis protein TsaE [Pullulanibacillus pueri]|uniref:tRNA threonylcarbamoyladenosine biosynthesis protein TsaE n=1 Tax=Pullulanibacillus pueri TaxID=1437324 RepID=A0A8J3EMF5_9BACL|nr:tRNA (adenosine(37)-N6)-threonylcarbamoyltransferase complex ATPase subunit type 1 TsaE [Pullulanibacillus pueri]MBM7682839.1 tRNA threonylcarbamoyladenosine biosynthesis protein TsaE [Pullulanibacillus pueri]GGH83397.1 tRNA (adenosine(37)-N6)-threonylcarbamoyltransferase complex ATPase subunit type 1 TsaE [Pullulanibacillus pueri]
MLEIICRSSEESMVLGERLANLLQPGDVITLEGDLGAGKTTFTKGIAKGLGVKRTVNSPTFTIIKEYKGTMPLYHMDVYRLEDEEDLGFDDFFHSEGITVIEWASQIKSQLPEERLEIYIKHGSEEKSRQFQFAPKGEHYEQLCEELLK